jgi:hypothetical protein
MKNILIRVLFLFLLAVFIEGKFLKPIRALPPLCGGPAKDFYLLAYAYSDEDILRAQHLLQIAKAAAPACTELSERITRLEKRLNAQKHL